MQSCNSLRASANNFDSEVSACCPKNSRTNFCCSFFCGSLANWASFSWLSNMRWAFLGWLALFFFGFVDFSRQSKSAHSSKYNWKKEPLVSRHIAQKKAAIERNALWLLRPFLRTQKILMYLWLNTKKITLDLLGSSTRQLLHCCGLISLQ